MENKNVIVEKVEKKPSAVENFGKVSLQVGEKLGKAVTEWFTGKQLTKEEKELNEIRKDRRLQLKLIQEDAQFERDMELAKRGEYVPPAPVVKAKKKDDNMFSNLGKYNPLEDFNKNKSLGSQNINTKIQSKEPDFGLNGFAGSVNPMETRGKRRI